jgi:starvation-inducible DNA-binding protein
MLSGQCSEGYRLHLGRYRQHLFATQVFLGVLLPFNRIHMENLNHIGLDRTKAAELARNLNHLLAQYQVFYMNVRGLHWNIRGEKFFELHVQFETLYTDLQLKVDEIAERILTLGHVPMHTYAEYLNHSELTIAKDISGWREAVANVLDAFQKVIVIQRKLLSLSGEIGDEGTNALMSDYIRAQEKSVWMFSALVSER